MIKVYAVEEVGDGFVMELNSYSKKSKEYEKSLEVSYKKDKCNPEDIVEYKLERRVINVIDC